MVANYKLLKRRIIEMYISVHQKIYEKCCTLSKKFKGISFHCPSWLKLRTYQLVAFNKEKQKNQS